MIGKLFGKRKEATFKERVDAFWDWFASEAPGMSAELAAKRSDRVIKVLSEQVEKLGAGFAWELGPVPGACSLAITGEGDLHRQFLTEYLISRAPGIHGWNFFPARQADPAKGLELRIGDKTFDPNQIWVAPTIDLESECFDLAVWHPEWQSLEQRQRWTMLFIFLDMHLGEYGTQQWIGQIEFSENQLKDAIRLDELPGFIREVRTKEGWEECAPTERHVLYQLEPHDQFPRGDIAFGTTSHRTLLNDYLEADGQLEDPLAGTGADYLYVTLGIEHLPKGQEVDTRAVFEDALDEGLRADELGRLLGGATGSRFGYIDLLIFDGERSVAAIERILREANAPSGMQLSYFAKEKRRSGKKLT